MTLISPTRSRKRELPTAAFFAFTLTTLSALTARPAHADPPPFTVNSVLDGGHVQGKRQLVLVGNFPTRGLRCNTSLWANQHPRCYGANLICNGGVSFGEIVSLTNPPAPQNLVVRVPERPTGSTCTVVAKLSDSGVNYATGELAVPSLSTPPLEIFGAVDRGRTSGIRSFELYGSFPTGANYQALVSCNGNALTAAVTTANNPSVTPGQVNIAFPDSGSSSLSCEIKVRRSSDQATTPPWAQRVNGSREVVSPLPSLFGAYHWGGFQASSALQNDNPLMGVRRLREAGLVGPVRLTLSPTADWYRTPSTDIYYDFRVPAPNSVSFDSRCSGMVTEFLPRSVCTARMQRALDEVPAGGTVVFTAMDGVSLAAAGYTNPVWMGNQVNFNNVVHEYYALAKALYLTQTGNKTFIIANWEADNQIYCGRAYGYVTGYGQDPVADAACPYEQNILGLRLWFQARKQGIAQATAEIGGAAQITVADGIEFAAYRFIQSVPTFYNKDGLRALVAYNKPRYALYSAWDSTNAGLIDQDLREITEYLSAIPSTQPITLGIGEFGRPGQLDLTSNAGQLNSWILKENTAAAKRASALSIARGLRSTLQLVLLWMAYDTIDEGQGLLSTEGVETNSWRAVAAGAMPALAPMGNNQIYSVREQSNRTSSQRKFELYGSYGSGPYEVQLKCNALGHFVTDAWTTAVATGHGGQLNTTLPLSDVSAEWWCTLRARGGSGVWTPDFGPIRSCGGGVCNPEPLPP